MTADVGVRLLLGDQVGCSCTKVTQALLFAGVEGELSQYHLNISSFESTHV
jgi:hypothetical protein